MKIIGLTGPIGAGKTEVANKIVQHASHIGMRPLKLSFATPLKAMLATLMNTVGYDGHQRMNNKEWRNVSIPELKGTTPRHMATTLGTEWGRDCISHTLWSDIGIVRAIQSNADLVVFDDVRFLTELDGIEAAGGMTFELFRFDAAYDTSHRSEGELAGIPPGINNDSAPEVAAKEIMELINKVEEMT